jgi:hypothetical protein
MLYPLPSRICLPRCGWACTESPVLASGSRAKKGDPGYSGFGARHRQVGERKKVNMVHRYLSVMLKQHFEKLTEAVPHKTDSVLSALAARAEWPKHPPVASTLPVVREGRFGALVRNSPSPLSTFVDIARRCVARQSPNLPWTIQVKPSDQSEFITFEHFAGRD